MLCKLGELAAFLPGRYSSGGGSQQMFCKLGELAAFLPGRLSSFEVEINNCSASLAYKEKSCIDTLLGGALPAPNVLHWSPVCTIWGLPGPFDLQGNAAGRRKRVVQG